MMALAAVFPLGIDGHHVHRAQFPVVCQVRACAVGVFVTYTLGWNRMGNLKAVPIIKYLSLSLAFSSGGIDLLASTQ